MRTSSSCPGAPGASDESGTAESTAAEASALTPAELWPAPLLTARDLVAAGLQPGPAFGVLLEELEEAQLAGEVECRDQALAWLALRRGDMSGPGGG